MNTKQRSAMIFVLLLSLVISSCAPGQLFGPTATPTQIPTLRPTSTPIPTSTPTSTPIPPRSGVSITVDSADVGQLPDVVPTDWLAKETELPRYQIDFVDNVDNNGFGNILDFCHYSGGHILELTSLNVTATITDLQTGIVIAQGNFWGKGNSSSLGCPASYMFSSLTEEKIAKFPDKAEFAVWLQIMMTPLGFIPPSDFPTLIPALTTWKAGIPIMPGAITGQEEDSQDYYFKIKASATDITSYYQEQMPTLGWKVVAGYADVFTGGFFVKGSVSVSITIRPYGGDFNDVVLLLGYQ
jgi:hypothetical protein